MSMMGELKYFLGFQIKQLKEGTFLCQTKHIADMLKKFDMEGAKPIKTPMATNRHLDLNQEGKSLDQKVYRSMIGSLLYLCASRPDIMLSVCMCARSQAAPKECHLVAVKRILRYLIHTPPLAYGILRAPLSIFLAIPIRIMTVAKLIARAQRGLANSLAGPWCRGALRNKTVWPFPPLKPSMLQSALVVLNYFG